MHLSALAPEIWAEREFGRSELGDGRLSRRLVQVAAALATRPSGTLPRALPDWAELKGAYRMLHQDQVKPQQILAPHLQQTYQRTLAGGHCLLIEDTTSLDFTFHGATRGLGRIGNNGGRGIYLHSTLAVPREGAAVLGLFAQETWMRLPRSDGTTRKTESSRQIRQRPRESQRWARCLEGRTLPAGQYSFVADQEGDIYEVFDRCLAAQVGMVLRIRGDRSLEGEDRKVLEAIRQAPVRGRIVLSLRARPRQPARTAVLEVRSASLKLRAPLDQPKEQKSPSHELNVLLLEEINAPAGVEPIRWVLLTSWPVGTLEQCQAVAQAYTLRWLIEEYHKCLKSGCSVEKSQLEEGQSLLRLLAILAVVAVRLLDAKLLARREPEGKTLGRQLDPAMLAVLKSRYGTPEGGWTNRQVIRHIARMGGFLARRSDGEPGWITLWRGFRELQLLAEGYDLGKRCG